MTDEPLSWGGLNFPDDLLAPHSFLVGSTGSGKTVLLRMLMRGALLDWSDTLRARAVVYDGKRELYPVLIGMGIKRSEVHIMLPTDQRSVPWDIAVDITTPDEALVLAKTLAPDRANDNNPFFMTATQALLASTMWALHTSRTHEWDLYDVVEAMRTPRRLEAVCNLNERSRAAYLSYFSEPKQGGGIMATIQNSVIFAYESIGVLWRRSRNKRLSLRRWAATPRSGVLLMMPDAGSSSVELVNRAMFRFLAELLETRPELHNVGEGNESWLFLDEFRFANELPMLDALLAKGRSRGVHVALASQTIEGIIDVYNEQKTYDMLSNAANLAVLRLAKSPAAEKLAALFGSNEVEEEEESTSVTNSYSGFFSLFADSTSKGKTISKRKVEKKNVLVSTLTGFPQAGEEHGIHGVFSTPSIGTWWGPIPWQVVEEELRPLSTDEPFVRRGSADFIPPSYVE